ncbi:hypothetical protein SS50377_21017 [Spironucleus salmonicida]|uniref:Uncharacterized protein n=1 Tax=Spironucleus salmonicida TaxID=348837 RepID=A0A9P8M276_9EUKA|nr:hypothetical protein SS50377_21017 [Spironucleus salmonicida]
MQTQSLKQTSKVISQIDYFLSYLSQNKKDWPKISQPIVSTQSKKSFYSKLYQEGLDHRKNQQQYFEIGEINAVLLSNSIHTNKKSDMILSKFQKFE